MFSYGLSTIKKHRLLKKTEYNFNVNHFVYNVIAYSTIALSTFKLFLFVSLFTINEKPLNRVVPIFCWTLHDQRFIDSGRIVCFIV